MVQTRSQTLVLAHLGLTMLEDERYASWLGEDEPSDEGRLSIEESF